MPITINGSGTLTGISAGGLPDGVVDTDVLANNAVTFGKIGTTEQGQLCKAWVNFTTALADANYATALSFDLFTTIQSSLSASSYTTSSFEVRIYYNGAFMDRATISCAVFR